MASEGKGKGFPLSPTEHISAQTWLESLLLEGINLMLELKDDFKKSGKD